LDISSSSHLQLCSLSLSPKFIKLRELDNDDDEISRARCLLVLAS